MNIAEDELGNIDVLLNNAGINGPEKSIADISISEWDGSFEYKSQMFITLQSRSCQGNVKVWNRTAIR
ncbi:MAG: hypothetical protein ACRD80_00970 [Nitrososphaeraceae archaeon]